MQGDPSRGGPQDPVTPFGPMLLGAGAALAAYAVLSPESLLSLVLWAFLP